MYELGLVVLENRNVEGEMVQLHGVVGTFYFVYSNYGPTIMPQMKASEQGYSQILWLFPDGKDDFFITECGAMNLFVYWKNNKGIVELTTFPLEHNLILPGITRDSILQIAKGVQGIEGREDCSISCNIRNFDKRNRFGYLLLQLRRVVSR